MPTTSQLSENLTKEFIDFIDSVPAKRLSRNLRNLLLQYLATHKDGHSFDLDNLLIDMLSLFELLQAIEDEEIKTL